MRFLHFSTSDGPGGAGRAAFRLHSALRDAGHPSRMLVRQCARDHAGPALIGGRHDASDRDVEVIPTGLFAAQFRRLQKHLPWVRPARTRFTFNHDLEQGLRLERVLRTITQPPDAICLHWVTEFLTSRIIRRIHDHFRRPLLWTVMDQEPLTGGCHYSFGCQGYKRQCGNCPLLDRPSAGDRSRQVFQRKQRYLADLPITFVAPTSWVEDRLRQSALFRRHRIERIALPIDTTVFRSGDRDAARELLGVPRGRRVIFFGSSFLHEPRKGGAFLIEALHRAKSALGPRATRNPRENAGPGAVQPDDVLLLMAGHNGEELKQNLPFPVHDLSYLSDERRLALAYRAADVFVCPSVEDAGPMMIPESMLCGTPVVAFNTGGAPDLVVSGTTGFLASLGDAAHLARGLLQVLSSPDRAIMGELAAQSARLLHEPAVAARRYATLVTELSESKRPSAVENRNAA